MFTVLPDPFDDADCNRIPMAYLSRLVLATRNAGKRNEIEQLLKELNIEISFLPDYPDVPPIEEDRPTLEGNARKKARIVHELLGWPTLADDTGLEVDALDGRPGVYSARYAGTDGDAEANRRLLLRELDGAKNRSARFRTVLVYMDAQRTCTFEGICEGRIVEEPRGTHGFGYDPVFVPDGDHRTFAELPLATKNNMSHRGKALQRFLAFLKHSYRDHR